MSPIKIGIIGGSGLDDPDILEDRKERIITTPFGTTSDVLIEGKIDGVNCVLLARHGRKHSVTPSIINYRANIWALRDVGCTHVIATTATGSLQEYIKPGDLVVIDSFIDRTKTRPQTFYDGQDSSPAGICHLPMEPAFCPRTREILIATAKELGYNCHDKGTCITIEGPRFSSKAESLMFKQWGGDVINMTTVPEVILAKEAGLCYASIALATDYDCWRTTGDRVCVADVLAMFKKNCTKIITLIKTVIPKIAAEDWTNTIQDLKDTVHSSIMLSH